LEVTEDTGAGAATGGQNKVPAGDQVAGDSDMGLNAGGRLPGALKRTRVEGDEKLPSGSERNEGGDPMLA